MQVISDGLIVAMVLNRLPDSFKPLAVRVTQNEDVSFADSDREDYLFKAQDKKR